MLKAFSLKHMIFAGFGLVLALLMVLAAMSLRGTSIIGHDFTDYRQAARESLLVNDAAQTMLEARLRVMQYRITNDDEFAQRVASGIDHMLELKAEIADFMADEALTQEVAGLTDIVGQYQSTFDEVVELQTRRNIVVPMLNGAGRDARSALSEIMSTAYNDNDPAAAYYAARAQESLMLARYYGEKYLLANSPDDRNRTREEIAETLDRVHIARGEIQNPGRRALLGQFNDHFSQFMAHFDEVVSLIETRNSLLAQLDTFGPQLASGYGSVLQTVVDTQNTVGPRASAEVASVTRTTTIIAVIAVLAGAVAAFFIGRLISGAIANVVARMTDLAEGRLDIEITGDDRKDELGDMARALLVFQENGREKVRLEQEQAEQQKIAEEEKRRAMNELADSFEASVNEVVTGVSSAAEQMVSLSKVLSESAERAGERSTAVAAASEEASTNVETVAAASEEMTNSIAEVSTRISESAGMTDNAAKSADHTTQTVSKLSTSAQTIGEVISMISAIAEQTNLLALNATIEAARAGEAGKGFAVVASEVKSLANQTAKATEEISAQITGMQGDTDAVVEAIDKIGGMIKELNSTSSSIAAAVEEQHSATQEIARNTLQAADGTREVSSNITAVSSAVQETGQAASEVLTASSQLASEAERLRENVADFLRNVRAA